jgi:hypothetical protein
MKLLVLRLCQSTSPSHGKRLTLEQCAQLKKGVTLPQLSILTSIAQGLHSTSFMEPRNK